MQCLTVFWTNVSKNDTIIFLIAEKPEDGSQRQRKKAQGVDSAGNVHTQDLDLHIQWVQKVFRPPSIFHSMLYCSHLLKSFKFIFFLINVHTAPHIDRKTQNCWHFCRFIKKEKLKYHMVLSIQTLCCDTHIFNSGAVHFFWSSLRWFYTFIWVQLCLLILIGLD